MKNIQVMIIDDSALVRQVLSEIVNKADGMEVVDVAIDPVFALRKLEKIRPDVITLDIEMPRMDGLSFLEKLMRENPLPVVMCSKLTQKSAPESLRALRLGAIELVAKPLINMKQELSSQNKEIVRAIRAAASVDPAKLKAAAGIDSPKISIEAKRSADVILPAQILATRTSASRLVAIGASTGGTQALEYLLTRLDANTPGMVVVQHMPKAFTGAFAERLDSISALQVKEAEHGDRIERGKVLIAPGDQHLLVENLAGNLFVALRHGPEVSRHCPSVDVLFRSAAQAAANETLGIIMTGMGDDGARGLKELYDSGAFTVAQDEASCVVFGMPARALQYGGVSTSCALQNLPDLIKTFGQPDAPASRAANIT